MKHLILVFLCAFLTLQFPGQPWQGLRSLWGSFYRSLNPLGLKNRSGAAGSL